MDYLTKIKTLDTSYKEYFMYYQGFKNSFLAYASKTNMLKKWDKMCSIQDWIDFSIERVNGYSFTDFSIYRINDKTFFIMELISCVNLIVDGIEGLSHIVSLSKKEYEKMIINLDTFINTRLSNMKHDDFLGITNKSDIDYFKHIRSVFGQHPTNLKVDEKYVFASWTHDFKSVDSDLSVNVYVNDPDNAWGYRMNVIVSELLDFCNDIFKIGYELLEILQGQVLEFFKGLVVESIYNPSDDINLKIMKLKKAITERYYKTEESYYYEVLKEIEDGIFNVTISDFPSIYEDYAAKLVLATEEIHEIVRNVKDDNLTVFESIDVDWWQICSCDYIPKKAEAYMAGESKHYDNYLKACFEISKVLNISSSEIKCYADYRFLKYVLFKKNKKFFTE